MLNRMVGMVAALLSAAPGLVGPHAQALAFPAKAVLAPTAPSPRSSLPS